MSDFKSLYDRVLLAQAAVQEVLNQVDAAMAKGNDEGNAEALALEPKLDEAIKARDEATSFYDKVLNAHKSNNVAVNFVPVSETPNEPEEEEPAGVMKRGDFFALETADREKFIRDGGKIED